MIRDGDGRPPPGSARAMPELTEAEILREARIEAYLSGELSTEERAAFEKEITGDGELASAVSLQSELDRSLRAAWTPPPSAPALPAESGETGPGLKLVGAEDGEAVRRRVAPRPSGARWGRLAAAAAIILSIGIAVRLYVGVPLPEGIVPPGTLYTRLVKTGWNPAVVCKDDAEFIALVEKQLGQGLSAAAATPAVQLVGWGYQSDYEGSPISPKTMMLLTRVEGQPVLVLIDRRDADRKIKVDEQSGLSLFRREFGDLVVYELTPLDRERVLPVLSVPGK